MEKRIYKDEAYPVYGLADPWGDETVDVEESFWQYYVTVMESYEELQAELRKMYEDAGYRG